MPGHRDERQECQSSPWDWMVKTGLEISEIFLSRAGAWIGTGLKLHVGLNGPEVKSVAI